MDESTIQEALTFLEGMLRDPTCEISVERGVIRMPNYHTGYMEGRPSEGRTVTIMVHGGAKDETESPMESFFRHFPLNGG